MTSDQRRYLKTLDREMADVLAEVREESAIAERDAIIAADDEALCELWRERAQLQMRIERLESRNRVYRGALLFGLAAVVAAVVWR